MHVYIYKFFLAGISRPVCLENDDHHNQEQAEMRLWGHLFFIASAFIPVTVEGNILREVSGRSICLKYSMLGIEALEPKPKLFQCWGAIF